MTPETRTPQILLAAAALALAAVCIGCGAEGREDPILRLSAEEALEQGKAFFEEEKYGRAEPLLIHAFEVEPNSRTGREALLLAADALFLYGGTDSYIKCEAKYRDFLNRFPTSERSDYAQFQVANCLAKRVEKPDRDQKVTREALQAYEELMRLYPTSPYAAEARVKIDEVLNNMAAHEFVIGDFYLTMKNCVAAIARLDYLREEYPNYVEMDKVYRTLGMAYTLCERTDDAEAIFDDLQEQFPESEHLIGLEKERKGYAAMAEKYAKRGKKRMDRARRGSN